MKKRKNFLKESKYLRFWLVVALVAGFSSVIFFSITYLNENVLCDMDCRVKNEVSIALVLLSLFGLFVGSLTYYLISERYEKRITKMQKDATVTMRFLEGVEKTIIKSIIESGGEITQSNISKETGLSRTKVFRALKRLEEKDILKKKPHGMTNIIELKEELKEVLIDK